MPATGPRAPARTLVAVRAIVPVTQMPPNRAEPILATPWATSSQLERWRRPVMPSATTAESSDSMAPSSAKADRVGQHRLHLRKAECPAGWAAGSVRRDAAEARADGLDRQAEGPGRDRGGDDGDQHARPVRPESLQADDEADRQHREADGRRVDRAEGRRQGFQLGDQRARFLARQRQAEQFLDLAGEDDDGDAGGEADGHRIGNELDVGRRAAG